MCCAGQRGTQTPPRKDRRVTANPRTHIILIDGTLSTLKEGHETHIGWLYKQLGQSTMTTSVHYIPGLQWGNWRTSWRVLVGRGLSAQIQEAYVPERWEADETGAPHEM